MLMIHYGKFLLGGILALPTSIGLVAAQNFNLTLRDQVTYPYSCASLWGYVAGGREYALVGTYIGLSIVDVTDPDNAVVLFDIDHAGAHSLWREVKTWGHYAYATNEEGNGLLIVDLQNLPTAVTQYQFIYQDAAGKKQTTGHTLYIDEKGRLFVFGGNYAQGYTCFDLTVDPLNPPYLGKYNAHYIHDGFVRGDTLWASEIYDGILRIILVSNPATPVVLADIPTPGSFTHNAWPTSDNRYVFTTDEVTNSYITAYDVSDLSNVTELDRAQASPGTGSIVHNVHLYNDTFLVAAYYRDGVVLFDVSDPSNMVKVGAYDTYAGSGSGFNGTWGVYPWLPSGNIIASNIEDGLFVLTPIYEQAARLEGTVTDAVSGLPIYDATVEILNTSAWEMTDLVGKYKTGLVGSGTYTVRFSKSGYQTADIAGVLLIAGVTQTVNAALQPIATATVTGTVVDSLTGAPIAGAQVRMVGSLGFDLQAVTDAQGNFVLSCYYDTYSVYCGKWGYLQNGVMNYVVSAAPVPIVITLRKGYYDDFMLPLGWTVTGSAQSGHWVRAEPTGTYYMSIPYNPEYDIAGDWGDHCFVTGNDVSNIYAIGEDDVDNGNTQLTSPSMDVAAMGDPVLRFYAWFANAGGNGNPNDTLRVFLLEGSTAKEALKIHKNNFPTNQWNFHELHLKDFLSTLNNVSVRFQTSDAQSTGHVVEAAIDYFRVVDQLAVSVQPPLLHTNLRVYPNPFSDYATLYAANLEEPAEVWVTDLAGKVIYRSSLQQNIALPLGNQWPAGTYLVYVRSTESTKASLLLVKQ